MVSVAFLRAVNLGGKTLRTKDLAEELGIINVGAAGTFVAAMAPRTLKSRLKSKLPFETEILVCKVEEICALLVSNPFGSKAPKSGVKWFLTILEKAPKSPPQLPLERPAGKLWEVRLVAMKDLFVFSERYRRGPRTLYPNALIEKEFAVASTTRTWDTIVKVCNAMGKL